MGWILFLFTLDSARKLRTLGVHWRITENRHFAHELVILSMVKQALLLLILSAILGLGVNLISPNAVSYISDFRDLSGTDGPVVPPTAAAGDPPFIDANNAYMQFTVGDVVFVDARDPAEFYCGTIPGSVNIPFEWMPEENLEAYIDSALGYVSKDHAIITYCSGEECDLSLHLARNLQDFGYTNVEIFFGGSRDWEVLGLKLERSPECAQ